MAERCPRGVLPVPGTLSRHWYALRLMSRAEFTVDAALTGRGIESFLPGYEEAVRWSDRVKHIFRPLFPGYIFARLDRASLVDALKIAGVIQLLPTSLKPLPIEEHEIENVRRLLEAAPRATECDYAAGELVTIDSGPLAGVSGVVVKTKGSNRLVVRIELLMRAVSVELDVATVIRKEEK